MIENLTTINYANAAGMLEAIRVTVDARLDELEADGCKFTPLWHTLNKVYDQINWAARDMMEAGKLDPIGNTKPTGVDRGK